MSQIPVVSVVMITYGHENYIREAIESVLMQNCDFEVELIVANDCSPDQTDLIIKDIIQNHPRGNWIKYHNHEKNIGMMPNFIFALEKAKGKYVALCEGDDYWTDPLKLQKQVDFLEANEAYSFCFHDALEIFQSSGEQKNRIGTKKIDAVVDLKSVLIENNFPTASLVFRTSVYPATSNILSATSKGDYALVVCLAEKGLGKYFPEVMCAYRMHDGGVWSSKSSTYKLAESVKFYDLLYSYFKEHAIRKVIVQKRNKTLESQSLGALRNGKFWIGCKGLLSHRNFTSDERLKSASFRKILSAVKSGLLKS